MDASLFPVTRRKYLREKTREMVYFVSRSLRFHFLASRLHSLPMTSGKQRQREQKV